MALVTTGSASTDAPGVSAPSGIGIVRCTFIDTSRPTYDYATGKSIPSRTLETEIRYPARTAAGAGEVPGAPPAARNNRYPLVLFSHGFAYLPDHYAPLLDAWVRAGFVVASPLFPDTIPSAVNAAGGAGEADIVNQPGDVAFVARTLASDARRRSPECDSVFGLLASGPIAIAGQSDGASTVAALGYLRADASLRNGLGVAAVLVLSGATFDSNPGAYADPAGAPPLLAVESRNDACNPPEAAAQIYNEISGAPKWFLATNGKSHIGEYIDTEPVPFALVARVTTAFLQAAITSPKSLAAALDAAVAHAGPTGTLTSGPDAPALPDLEMNVSACYLDLG